MFSARRGNEKLWGKCDPILRRCERRSGGEKVVPRNCVSLNTHNAEAMRSRGENLIPDLCVPSLHVTQRNEWHHRVQFNSVNHAFPPSAHQHHGKCKSLCPNW